MPIQQQQMPEDISALDIDALRMLLLAERQTVQALKEKLYTRDTEIERLTHIISKLRRMQFGRSSEKLDRQIEQMELKFEELQADRAAEEAAAAGDTPARENKKPARRPLPSHLEREIHTHAPQEQG